MIVSTRREAQPSVASRVNESTLAIEYERVLTLLLLLLPDASDGLVEYGVCSKWLLLLVVIRFEMLHVGPDQPLTKTQRHY